jgi:4'-phosphopantetheinyl transferase
LRFNLSHCATRVVCVVCSELDCGIDVEATSRAVDSTVLIQRCLSARERAWVTAAAPRLRGERFLRLWTLKEAVTKAVGLGLSLPFAAIDVDAGGSPEVRSAPPEASGPWWLSLRRAADGHLEALALRVSRHDAVALVYEDWTDRGCIRHASECHSRAFARVKDSADGQLPGDELQ